MDKLENVNMKTFIGKAHKNTEFFILTNHNCEVVLTLLDIQLNKLILIIHLLISVYKKHRLCLSITTDIQRLSLFSASQYIFFLTLI